MRLPVLDLLLSANMRIFSLEGIGIPNLNSWQVPRSPTRHQAQLRERFLHKPRGLLRKMPRLEHSDEKSQYTDPEKFDFANRARLKNLRPAYRGGKRSTRSQPLAPSSESQSPRSFPPEDLQWLRESRGWDSFWLVLSFFVKESRAGEPWHPESFSTSLNSAPRSEWQVAGRRGASARCPITATRRAAKAARAHRPAGCSSGPAWPVACARAAAPPRERSAAGGREPEGGRSTGWLPAAWGCRRLDSAQ